MAYRLAFKRSVARDLRRLDTPEAERVLTKLADELPQCAASYPELTGRFAGLRKSRVDGYRVFFAILGATALVTRIAHRRDADRS